MKKRIELSDSDIELMRYVKIRLEFFSEDQPTNKILADKVEELKKLFERIRDEFYGI